MKSEIIIAAAFLIVCVAIFVLSATALCFLVSAAYHYGFSFAAFVFVAMALTVLGISGSFVWMQASDLKIDFERYIHWRKLKS